MQQQNYFLKSVFVFGILCFGFFQISEALVTETEYTNDVSYATDSSRKDYYEGDSGGTIDGSPATRIAGGQNTKWKMYPYNVVVLNEGSFVCGGSLIANKTVLTAARCTYNLEVNQLSIRIESDSHNKGGTVIKVRAKCEHPYYRGPNGINYDVALLMLSTKSTVKPLRLAQASTKDDQYFNNKANVTGWGRIDHYKNNPKNKLKVTSVTGISFADCKAGFEKPADRRKVTKAVMCFGKDDSTCDGDYGAPLVRREADGIDSQIGVANTNMCDKRGQPNSYARISNKRNRDFIMGECKKK